MMAAERFWTVTNRLPAEPWYDRATLDVTKMEAAAKERSWSRHSGQHKTFTPGCAAHSLVRTSQC